MRAWAIGSGLLLMAVVIGVIGCGGSLNSDGGLPPCSSLGACECRAASDRCTMQTESCWCASECDPTISCICGGGKFISCQDKAPTCACLMCGCGLATPPLR